MKKSLIAALLLLATAFAATAQTSIMSFREMRDFVQSRPAEYQRLVERLNAADTTLSLNDLRILYYSPAFAPDYDGGYYGEPEYIAVFAKGREFYLKAYEQCREFLRKNPTSLRATFDAWNIGRIAGRPEREIAPWARRFAALSLAAISSGEGTMDSPVSVVYLYDQEPILKQLFGISNVTEEEFTYNSAGSTCNRVRFDKCDPAKFSGTEAIFDVTLPVAAMTKKMNEE